MSANPLFAFGIARSGTNLIAGMLNARRDTHLALDPLMPFFKTARTAIVAQTGSEALMSRYPEREPFQDCYFDPLGFGLLDAIMAGTFDHPLASGAQLAAAVAARAALESPELSALLAGVDGRSLAAFLASVIDAVQAHAGRPLRWCGTKEVWTTEFIPVLARTLPRSRFIVVRRDPRAILASLVAMMRRDESQTAHTISYMRHWRKEAAVLDALRADAALTGRLLVLQYERVVAGPDAAARKICGFLDLPFDPSMLRPAAADGSTSRGNSSFGDMQGIAATSLARWREVIDEDTVAAVECLCGPDMRAESYEPATCGFAIAEAAVRRASLRANDNPGSWRSDSRDVEADLEAEMKRWRMLNDPEGHSGGDIRRHFLFEPQFRKLVSVMNSERVGVQSAFRGAQ